MPRHTIDEPGAGGLDSIIDREVQQSGDRAADLLFAFDEVLTLTIMQKEAGILFGLDASRKAFSVGGPISFSELAPQGVLAAVVPRPVAVVSGNARQLLRSRRTALNLLARLSGVATVTGGFMRAVDGLPVRIAGTRKTQPALSALEGAAIESAGGLAWSSSAADRVLIKRLHGELLGGLGRAVECSRESHPDVELDVECESVEQVASLRGLELSRIVLDNMWPNEVAEAMLEIRSWGALAGRPFVEATGGITRLTARAYAETGVDQLTVGALTRAAPSLDFSLAIGLPIDCVGRSS